MDTLNRALVDIDYQNDFVIGSMGCADALALEPLIFDKVSEAIDNGEDVYFTRDTHKADEYMESAEGRKYPVMHCIEGTDGCEIFGRLRRLSTECNVITKDTYGSVDLAKRLQALGYAEVELCGVVTNICVIANAILIKTLMPECNVVVNPDLVASGDRELGESALNVMASLGITVLGR